MRANGIENSAEFAEATVKISKQTFHAWVYKSINPENIAAAPMIRCARALGTNPDYLMLLSDDPRPEYALSSRESQLVEAFRVLEEKDQDRLLRAAADWVNESPSPPSALAPFRAPMPQTPER